jgi:hypothetical protein
MHGRPVTARHAVLALLVLTAVYGGIGGCLAAQNADPPKILEVAVGVLMLVLTYVWYYVDAKERKYKRTALLGGAIILFSIVAVPYYLVRSRPAGHKGKALVRFLGFCALSVVVFVLAAVPAAMLAPGG